MTVHISYRYVKPEHKHGEWLTAAKLPEKLLAETDQNIPCVKVSGTIFHFGQQPTTPKAEITYRVLPKGTVVVLIQD